jgi:hypothetical protein
MKRRGRRSVASLAVVTPLPHERRPPPPAELTEAQATVWRDTVSTMPPGWFRHESFPVLTAYCRHVVRARRLDAEIEKQTASVDDPTLLEKLYAMAKREGRAVLAHARALRITNQSRLDPKTAARKARNMIPPSYYEQMAYDAQ